MKVGERIELIRERLPYSLQVIAFPSRCGPAPEARDCYREDEDTVRERQAQATALRADRMLMPKTEGRPDKHTRRKLIKRFRP